MNITQTNGISRFTRGASICLALTGLVACGDDTEASSRSKDAFCKIEMEIDDSFNAAFEGLGDDPTAEEQAAALADVSSTVLETFRDDYVSTAPTEILDDATAVWAAAERAAAGNPEAYDEPTVIAAMGNVDTYCYGPSSS